MQFYIPAGTAGTNVRNAPGGSTILGTVPLGTPVPALKVESFPGGTYALVQFANKTGWAIVKDNSGRVLGMVVEIEMPGVPDKAAIRAALITARDILAKQIEALE